MQYVIALSRAIMTVDDETVLLVAIQCTAASHDVSDGWMGGCEWYHAHSV